MRLTDSGSGQPVVSGILTELQTPFDFKSIATKDKATVSNKMISLVQTLHDRYGVIHGHIKPGNLLRCSDGKLRLCDFGSARLVYECPEAWEGLASDSYLAPNRDYFNTSAPPTTKDDLFALGVSLWELHVGEDALMKDVLKERRTVDLSRVEDLTRLPNN